MERRFVGYGIQGLGEKEEVLSAAVREQTTPLLLNCVAVCSLKTQV